METDGGQVSLAERRSYSSCADRKSMRPRPRRRNRFPPAFASTSLLQLSKSNSSDIMRFSSLLLYSGK